MSKKRGRPALKTYKKVSEKLNRTPYINKAALAAELGMTRPSLYNKLANGKWTPKEILQLKKIGLL